MTSLFNLFCYFSRKNFPLLEAFLRALYFLSIPLTFSSVTSILFAYLSAIFCGY